MAILLFIAPVYASISTVPQRIDALEPESSINTAVNFIENIPQWIFNLPGRISPTEIFDRLASINLLSILYVFPLFFFPVPILHLLPFGIVVIDSIRPTINFVLKFLIYAVRNLSTILSYFISVPINTLLNLFRSIREVPRFVIDSIELFIRIITFVVALIGGVILSIIFSPIFLINAIIILLTIFIGPKIFIEDGTLENIPDIIGNLPEYTGQFDATLSYIIEHISSLATFNFVDTLSILSDLGLQIIIWQLSSSIVDAYTTIGEATPNLILKIPEYINSAIMGFVGTLNSVLGIEDILINFFRFMVRSPLLLPLVSENIAGFMEIINIIILNLPVLFESYISSVFGSMGVFAEPNNIRIVPHYMVESGISMASMGAALNGVFIDVAATADAIVRTINTELINMPLSLEEHLFSWLSERVVTIPAFILSIIIGIVFSALYAPLFVSFIVLGFTIVFSQIFGNILYQLSLVLIGILEPLISLFTGFLEQLTSILGDLASTVPTIGPMVSAIMGACVYFINVPQLASMFLTGTLTTIIGGLLSVGETIGTFIYMILLNTPMQMIIYVSLTMLAMTVSFIFMYVIEIMFGVLMMTISAPAMLVLGSIDNVLVGIFGQWITLFTQVCKLPFMAYILCLPPGAIEMVESFIMIGMSIFSVIPAVYKTTISLFNGFVDLLRRAIRSIPNAPIYIYDSLRISMASTLSLPVVIIGLVINILIAIIYTLINIGELIGGEINPVDDFVTILLTFLSVMSFIVNTLALIVMDLPELISGAEYSVAKSMAMFPVIQSIIPSYPYAASHILPENIINDISYALWAPIQFIGNLLIKIMNYIISGQWARSILENI